MAEFHAALNCSHTTGLLRFFIGLRLTLYRKLLLLK
jgi:hypothetical protein